MLVHILHQGPEGITLKLDAEALADFKKNILDKALNCQPDAHADWKEFSDYLNHGRILQDYRKKDKPRPD